MRLSTRFDLTGRTAVVVTRAGGAGGACAHALGRAGAAVVLVTDDAEEGRHLVGRMRADDVDATLALTDVLDPSAADRTLAGAVQQHGRVDVLVNALDHRTPSAATDLGLPQWRESMHVNLDAVWLWSRAFGTAFVDQGGGAVVNLSSISGTIAGRPHWDAAHGAAQAAVLHLTRSLAAEWAAHGVRVNALATGFLRTDGDPTEDPRTRRHVLEDTPVGRLGTLEEITPAVVFLAGDASSFITGAVLVADGGYGLC